MSSWTVSLFREWMPYLSVRSILLLRNCLMHGQETQTDGGELLSLELKRPFSHPLTMRKRGSDFYTFEEVFIQKVYKHLTDHVPQCKTIIDLGANIGLASLYFAMRYPQCQLVAVEPDADNFRLLSSNLQALTRMGRGTMVQAGVWNRECDLEIDMTPHSSGDFNAISISEQSAGTATQTIHCLPIHKILETANFTSIDILKVDIEGAEVQLFEGDTSWLERVGCLAIEFHDTTRTDTDFDALIARYGFKIVSDDSHTVVALNKTRNGA